MTTQETFTPHVSSKMRISEFTLRTVFLGIILSIVFGAGNAFLGLKVGMTVSASIPAAVSSMVILRFFFKNVTILENNMVQTIASAGESLAAGVIFTIPAFAFLGESLSLSRITLLSALGGILGILFMIPLRRFLIVKEHHNLPYPEGTACAEILKAGEDSKSSGLTVVWGAVVGLAHKFLMSASHLWEEAPRWVIRSFQSTVVSLEASTALMGVGYIIGPRIALVCVSGGILGWLVLIPLISMFATDAITLYPSTIPLGQMSAEMIWSNYIRYIGAGTIIVGGIIGLAKALPIIVKSFTHAITHLINHDPEESHERTDDDLSMTWILLGSIAVVLGLWAINYNTLGVLPIAIMVVATFFFVTVSSRIVGLVGSSSNPASGMIITTLLITSLLFVSLGWTDSMYMFSAMTIGSVVGIAVCIAGDTSQDLKTGYIVGATPRYQQIGECIGVFASSLVMGLVLYLLDQAYVIGSDKLAAPQASMMAMLLKGVMGGNIPWDLVLIGIMIGVVLEFTALPILPFAIGLYLPLSMTTPMLLGAIVNWFVKWYSRDSEEAMHRGVLIASGLVAGDALMGILIALGVVVGLINLEGTPLYGASVSFGVFLVVAIFLGLYALKGSRNNSETKES